MSLRLVGGESEEFKARVVIPLRRSHHVTVSPPVVDIVIPVRNAESELAYSVERIHAFLRSQLPFSARITIADRASTDSTRAIADLLAAALTNIRVLHINEAGRGRALAAAWLTSDARVVASMDAGPSSELGALLPLLAPVISGHSELSVGLAGSSQRFGLLVELAKGARLAGAAMRADVARRLVPCMVGRGRLFDVELVFYALRAGMRIQERAMA